MFPTRYFANRYFAPRYFPKVGADIVVVVQDGDEVLYFVLNHRRRRQ